MGFTRKKIGAMIPPTFPPASPDEGDGLQRNAANPMVLK
ncbi:Unknown protein sequence [Pseudomonas coronafaciens pv. oryzae]|nr:Unknown protein sequence [Pseudomonas coronafaciens pv. oryzae]